MLNRNRKLNSYTDGWADIYRPKVSQTTFGAIENSLSVDPEDLVVRTAFKLCSKRDQDYDFAERRGFDLSMKIQALRRKGVDAGCRVAVDGRLFDVSHIDFTQTEMYLYLQEVGELDAR